MFAIAAGTFYAALYVYYPLPLSEGLLVGPDSYMQIVRLREFIDVGEWHHNLVTRSDAPYGEVSHWTKPFKLLLLLFSALLRPFMDVEASTHWAGVLIAPMLHIVLALSLAWASKPLIGNARLWVVPIVLLNFPVLSHATPGRADHHVLLLVMLAVTMGLMFRMILERETSRYAIAAGGAMGFALWLSTEFVVLLVTTLSFGVIWWIAESDVSTRGRQTIRKQVRFALGLMTAVAVALLLERAPANLLEPDIDRVSVVYLLLSVLAGAFWFGLAGLTHKFDTPHQFFGRFLAAAAGGAIAVSVMALTFPEFFLGPFAEISPIVTTYFLGSISDMRSAFELPLMTVAADYSDAALAIAIVVYLFAAKRMRVSSLAWLFLLSCLSIYFCLAVMHVRFTPAPAVLSAIPFAYSIDIVRRYASEKLAPAIGASLRIAVSFFLVIGPGILLTLLLIPFSSKGATQEATVDLRSCPIHKIAPYLDELPGTRIILSPDLYAGPALLYFTRHAVVGTPYHSNTKAIEDTFRIMTDLDDRRARQILARRGVALVLVCKRNDFSAILAPDAKDTLYARLKRRSAPAWLRPIALPAPIDEMFDLYAVQPAH